MTYSSQEACKDSITEERGNMYTNLAEELVKILHIVEERGKK